MVQVAFCLNDFLNDLHALLGLHNSILLVYFYSSLNAAVTVVNNDPDVLFAIKSCENDC